MNLSRSGSGRPLHISGFLFVVSGYEFDVGIHYIGQMNKGNFDRTLVDQLTDGQLDWEPLDDAYDVVNFGQNNINI